MSETLEQPPRPGSRSGRSCRGPRRPKTESEPLAPRARGAVHLSARTGDANAHLQPRHVSTIPSVICNALASLSRPPPAGVRFTYAARRPNSDRFAARGPAASPEAIRQPTHCTARLHLGTRSRARARHWGRPHGLELEAGAGQDLLRGAVKPPRFPLVAARRGAPSATSPEARTDSGTGGCSNLNSKPRCALLRNPNYRQTKPFLKDFHPTSYIYKGHKYIREIDE